MSWRDSLRLAVVAFVLGVNTLVLASGSGAMTGGITQRPEPGWAVRLELNGAPACSGSLIARRWVLTAGHCLLGYRKAQIAVRMRGATFAPANLFVEPRYTSRNLGFPDIGLVELPFDAVSFLGASLLPLGSSGDVTHFENKGVTVFGYGRDESGKMTSTIKKSLDSAWKMGKACQVKKAQCFVRQPWAKNVTAIKGGDSGGPWVGWRNGGWRVLAVVSGYLSSDVPNLQYGTSPSASGVAAWIASKVSSPPPTNREPLGSFDEAGPLPGAIRIRGWAADPDVPMSPITVHVYLDGRFGTALPADAPRGDVAGALPGYGPNHGFDRNVSAAPGSRTVCVFAINTPAGTNRQLGCRTLTVPEGPGVENFRVCPGADTHPYARDQLYGHQLFQCNRDYGSEMEPNDYLTCSVDIVRATGGIPAMRLVRGGQTVVTSGGGDYRIGGARWFHVLSYRWNPAIPSGSYVCEVLVNGNVIASRGFTVT